MKIKWFKKGKRMDEVKEVIEEKKESLRVETETKINRFIRIKKNLHEIEIKVPLMKGDECQINLKTSNVYLLPTIYPADRLELSGERAKQFVKDLHKATSEALKVME